MRRTSDSVTTTQRRRKQRLHTHGSHPPTTVKKRSSHRRDFSKYRLQTCVAGFVSQSHARQSHVPHQLAVGGHHPRRRRVRGVPEPLLQCSLRNTVHCDAHTTTQPTTNTGACMGTGAISLYRRACLKGRSKGRWEKQRRKETRRQRQQGYNHYADEGVVRYIHQEALRQARTHAHTYRRR
jgi:hypothetical protein